MVRSLGAIFFLMILLFFSTYGGFLLKHTGEVIKPRVPRWIAYYGYVLTSVVLIALIGVVIHITTSLFELI